jgi:hypothetical protein
LGADWEQIGIRNGWNDETGSSSQDKTLTIFDIFTYYEYQETIEKATKLLQKLAIVDGRILIENMPIKLLDEAVVHFENCRRGGQKLLSIFGK